MYQPGASTRACLWLPASGQGGLWPQGVDDAIVVAAGSVQDHGRLETVEVQIVQLRTEMRSEFSAIRAEIRQGDEQTRTFMRVLNEETRSDVRMLAEGLSDTREQLTVFRSEFDFFVARAEAFRVRTEAFQARNDAFQEDVRAQLAVIAARRTRKKR